MQSPLRNVRKAHGFTLQHVAAGVQVARKEQTIPKG